MGQPEQPTSGGPGRGSDVNDVLSVGDLARRPSRPPEDRLEAHVLSVLAAEMAQRPEAVLPRLVEIIVEEAIGESAGVGILEPDGAVRWAAVAGAWSAHPGGTVPLGAVTGDAPLLLAGPAGGFPAAGEILLVPLRAGDVPIGMLCAAVDGDRRRFDAEDLRLLTSFAGLAAAAHRMCGAVVAAGTVQKRLEACIAERTLELGESRERFRALVSAGGVMVYRTNATWTQMLEAQGLGTFPDTRAPSGDWLDRYVPRIDQPRVTAAIREAIRTASTYELEHRAWRVDGSAGWIVSRAVPLFRDGEIREWFGVAIDITARKEADERFRLMADAVPYILWITDAAGRIEFVNRRWSDYTHAPPPQTVDEAIARHVHPDDQAATQAALDPACPSGHYANEHRLRSASGEYRWFLARGEPYRDPVTGEIIRWYGASTDIHDLYKLQEMQQLLIAELQHRTRNLLAIVSSMARQTRRTTESLDSFSEQFQARLAALGRVQQLLSGTHGPNVLLRELIEGELAAGGTTVDDRRVSVRGPDVWLPAQAVQALALALHELATNAVKYGALAQEQAKLSVQWSLLDEGGRRFVSVRWTETGVRLPSDKPGRKGFGRQLIEQALPYDLGARTSWRLAADGVRCELKVPLES